MSIDAISVNAIIVFDIFLTISGYFVKKQFVKLRETLVGIPLTLGMSTKKN